MSIQMVKVRARITIGNLVVETPFIQSFSVTRARGQISNFSASLKVYYGQISGIIAGSNVTIEAGEGAPVNKIFTGMIKKATISPCFEDPSYVIMNVNGTDKLDFLQGKRYTRRCRSTRATWVSIENVTRKGLKSGKFKYVRKPAFEISYTDVSLVDGKLVFYGGQNTATIPNSPAPQPINVSGKEVKSSTSTEEGK